MRRYLDRRTYVKNPKPKPNYRSRVVAADGEYIPFTDQRYLKYAVLGPGIVHFRTQIVDGEEFVWGEAIEGRIVAEKELEEILED